jgi:hypothetical protein
MSCRHDESWHISVLSTDMMNPHIIQCCQTHLNQFCIRISWQLPTWKIITFIFFAKKNYLTATQIMNLHILQCCQTNLNQFGRWITWPAANNIANHRILQCCQTHLNQIDRKHTWQLPTWRILTSFSFARHIFTRLTDNIGTWQLPTWRILTSFSAASSVVDPKSFFSTSDPQLIFFGYGIGFLD